MARSFRKVVRAATRLARRATEKQLIAARRAAQIAAAKRRITPFVEGTVRRIPEGFPGAGRFAPKPGGAMPQVRSAEQVVQAVAPTRRRGTWVLSDRAKTSLRSTISSYDHDHEPDFKTQQAADDFVRRLSKLRSLQRELDRKDLSAPRRKTLEARLKALRDFDTEEGYLRTQRALRADVDLGKRHWMPPWKEGAEKAEDRIEEVPSEIRHLDQMFAEDKGISHGMIFTRPLDRKAFGIKPGESLDEVDEWTGKLVQDKGYSVVKVGNLPDAEELDAHFKGEAGQPQIFMSVMAPKGTKALFHDSPDGDPYAILDREQPFRITKVETVPEGGGGTGLPAGSKIVYAVVQPKVGAGHREPSRALGKALPEEEKAAPTRRGIVDEAELERAVAPKKVAPSTMGEGRPERSLEQLEKEKEITPEERGRLENVDRARGRQRAARDVEEQAGQQLDAEKRAAKALKAERDALERHQQSLDAHAKSLAARERVLKEREDAVEAAEATTRVIRSRSRMLDEDWEPGEPDAARMTARQRESFRNRVAELRRTGRLDFDNPQSDEDKRLVRLSKQLDDLEARKVPAAAERSAEQVATETRKVRKAAVRKAPPAAQVGSTVTRTEPNGQVRHGRALDVDDNGLMTVEWRRLPGEEGDDYTEGLVDARGEGIKVRAPRVKYGAGRRRIPPRPAPEVQRRIERDAQERGVESLTPQRGYGVTELDASQNVTRHGEVLQKLRPTAAEIREAEAEGRTAQGKLLVRWDDGTESRISPADWNDLRKYRLETAQQRRGRVTGEEQYKEVTARDLINADLDPEIAQESAEQKAARRVALEQRIIAQLARNRATGAKTVQQSRLEKILAEVGYARRHGRAFPGTESTPAKKVVKRAAKKAVETAPSGKKLTRPQQRIMSELRGKQQDPSVTDGWVLERDLSTTRPTLKRMVDDGILVQLEMPGARKGTVIRAYRPAEMGAAEPGAVLPGAAPVKKAARVVKKAVPEAEQPPLKKVARAAKKAAPAPEPAPAKKVVRKAAKKAEPEAAAPVKKAARVVKKAAPVKAAPVKKVAKLTPVELRERAREAQLPAELAPLRKMAQSMGIDLKKIKEPGVSGVRRAILRKMEASPSISATGASKKSSHPLARAGEGIAQSARAQAAKEQALVDLWVQRSPGAMPPDASEMKDLRILAGRAYTGESRETIAARAENLGLGDFAEAIRTTKRSDFAPAKVTKKAATKAAAPRAAKKTAAASKAAPKAAKKAATKVAAPKATKKTATPKVVKKAATKAAPPAPAPAPLAPPVSRPAPRTTPDRARELLHAEVPALLDGFHQFRGRRNDGGIADRALGAIEEWRTGAISYEEAIDRLYDVFRRYRKKARNAREKELRQRYFDQDVIDEFLARASLARIAAQTLRDLHRRGVRPAGNRRPSLQGPVRYRIPGTVSIGRKGRALQNLSGWMERLHDADARSVLTDWRNGHLTGGEAIRALRDIRDSKGAGVQGTAQRFLIERAIRQIRRLRRQGIDPGIERRGAVRRAPDERRRQIFEAAQQGSGGLGDSLKSLDDTALKRQLRQLGITEKTDDGWRRRAESLGIDTESVSPKSLRERILRTVLLQQQATSATGASKKVAPAAKKAVAKAVKAPAKVVKAPAKAVKAVAAAEPDLANHRKRESLAQYLDGVLSDPSAPAGFSRYRARLEAARGALRSKDAKERPTWTRLKNIFRASSSDDADTRQFMRDNSWRGLTDDQLLTSKTAAKKMVKKTMEAAKAAPVKVAKAPAKVVKRAAKAAAPEAAPAAKKVARRIPAVRQRALDAFQVEHGITRDDPEFQLRDRLASGELTPDQVIDELESALTKESHRRLINRDKEKIERITRTIGAIRASRQPEQRLVTSKERKAAAKAAEAVELPPTKAVKTVKKAVAPAKVTKKAAPVKKVAEPVKVTKKAAAVKKAAPAPEPTPVKKAVKRAAKKVAPRELATQEKALSTQLEKQFPDLTPGEIREQAKAVGLPTDGGALRPEAERLGIRPDRRSITNTWRALLAEREGKPLPADLRPEEEGPSISATGASKKAVAAVPVASSPAVRKIVDGLPEQWRGQVERILSGGDSRDRVTTRPGMAARLRTAASHMRTSARDRERVLPHWATNNDELRRVEAVAKHYERLADLIYPRKGTTPNTTSKLPTQDVRNGR